MPLLHVADGDTLLTPAEMLGSMADTLDGYADNGLRPTVLETAQLARILRVLCQRLDPPAPPPDAVVPPFVFRAARWGGGR